MPQFALYDDATGEIAAAIRCSAADVDANLGAGQAALEVDGLVRPSSDYVDLTGEPARASRPLFEPGLPETLAAGAPLAVTVPEGAVVTVTSTGAGSGSGTHVGGGPYIQPMTGSLVGDVVTVELSLFPYRPFTGVVEIV